MKDLVIKSGDFTFENKRYRCKPLEHVKGKIEMYNVPICNTGNVTLSVQGCFNMSIEKLTCSNITWRKEELFTLTGGILNAKNKLVTTSNSVTGSKIFKNAYSIWGSLIKLSNTNFHGNN